MSVSLAAGLVLSLACAGAATAAPRAFILTNNSLLSIDAASPLGGGPTLPIIGLNAGDTLVGIDVRPQNGHLYGLGFNSVAGTVTLYHISHRTGVATAAGAAVSFTTDGSTETAPTWAIGEGIEGGPTGASTFVLVSNGSSTTGTVRFTVVYDDGTRQQKDYTLLGNARLTVRIAEDFVLARNARFSVLVESVTAGVPITVETARYQSGAIFGEGGGAALATRIR